MHIIDTHIHLNSSEYGSQIDLLIENALNLEVKQFIIPNVDVHSMDSMFELVSKYPMNCYPMLGLHPCYVKEDNQIQLETIYNQLKLHKVVAIGEIGIDLYWDKTTYDIQTQALELQCEWAIDLNLPVAIHSRDAFNESYKILLPYMKRGLQGVFHCFSNSIDDAKKILEYNWYMGIGGVVTYKKSELPNVIQEIGLTNLVLETDGPYLAPVPFRGKKNEPEMIIQVAQKIADILSLPIELVIEKTHSNAKQLFGI
jgi:TatD DNase family protein